jgi:hypothetical protein
MAAVSAGIAGERTATVPVHPKSIPIAAGALGLGVIAQLLFFDVGLGINFPIAVAALLVAAWLAGGRPLRGLRPADAWMPAAAIVLASFVALRGDRTLVTLDVLGSLALAAASIAVFGGLRVVERPLGIVLMLAGRVIGAAAAQAAAIVATVSRQLPASRGRGSLGPWAGVLRGLLIALPLVLLFVALFSAADAVFAEWTERLTDWELDLGGFIGRVVVALVVAWVAAGLLGFAARPGDDPTEAELLGAWARRPRIGTTETITVLVVIGAVFAVFVVLQAAYLFGGRDTLAETGLTYAEYARRGFFELLAVAFLVGGLVLVAESFVRERTLAYRVALIGLVAMTLVVLASAFLRLRLYQDAYGWTELRFYVLAAIFWLAIGAVMAVATILANRSGWLVHGLVVLSVVFGLAFNVIGPVRFVAEQNLARPSGRIDPDWAYIVSLGADAAPYAMQWFGWYGDRPLPPAVVERFMDEVAAASGLDDPGNDTWQAWNLSREKARELLGR